MTLGFVFVYLLENSFHDRSIYKYLIFKNIIYAEIFYNIFLIFSKLCLFIWYLYDIYIILFLKILR